MLEREITVKEFMKAVENGLYDITNEDSWNIFIDMMQAKISYSENDNELTFYCGHALYGIASFTVNIDNINYITEVKTGKTTDYRISFNGIMSDLQIEKYTDLKGVLENDNM